MSKLLDYLGLLQFLAKLKTLFVTALGTSGKYLTWTKNGETSNITIPYATKSSELVPLQTKQYTGVIGTANNLPGATFYFMSVLPEDRAKPCTVKYRIYASMEGLADGIEESIVTMTFSKNAVVSYDVWNYVVNTSYRPYYYHYRYLTTLAGHNSGYGHLIGVGMRYSYNPATAANARTYVIDILDVRGGTVTFFDTMLKFANVPGTGATNYSGESTYDATTNGETHLGDRNDVNYQNREYYGARKTNAALYRYMICLTKSDGSLVPINSVSNSVATTKTLTTDSFDPFGDIFFWNATTTYSADANVGDGYWYRLMVCDLRYSFNCGGYDATGILVARSPLYLVAVPQVDGTAVLHSSPLSQVLPNTEDGLIYIYLGRVYVDTYPYRVALSLNHPVYHYKNGAIRYWTSEQDPIFSASPAAGITSANITSWNGKYSLPSGGTSTQFVKGDGTLDSTSYENTNNKVTSLSISSTDTLYPSAKAVYNLCRLNNLLKDYFTFIAKSSGTFKFNGLSSGGTTNAIQYSIDNGNTWSNAAQTVEINVQNGDIVLWKGEMTPIEGQIQNVNNCGIGKFSESTAYFDVKGNIMSLLFGDDYANQTSLSNKNCAFAALFFQAKVIDASNLILPATTLSYYCYAFLFQGCTSLTTAPQLPAITLAECCYKNMFYDCTSLIIAPQLNATTLSDGCYYNMFGGCTTLTTAPELRVTTLAYLCYAYMFKGCTNLNYIKMLATDISAGSCFYYWALNVAASGTFIKAAEMTSLPNGISGIPNGWQTYTEEEYELVRLYQLNSKENTSNKVISLSASSTDTQYPSAKCVYDAINNVNPRIPITNHGTSDTTFALTPNIYHKWGSVSTLTLTLAAPSDNTVLNEYMFSFVSPSTPTTLSLPASVNWAIDLQIEPNKTYLITIIDDLATFVTVDMLNIIT